MARGDSGSGAGEFLAEFPPVLMGGFARCSAPLARSLALLSQLRVEWRDEIVAFPRPAAFARCLPISESIPGLGPAYRHREHRGGLRPDLIVA